MGIEDKLGLVTFKSDTQSHIHIVSPKPCLEECKDKPCTTACPADVYRWEDNKIVVSYENCIECGGCRMICPFDNITCHWPRGGFGVKYRFG